MKEQGQSSLWGEGRSLSFIFLVYPNTVARTQWTPGEPTAYSWGSRVPLKDGLQGVTMLWETHFFAHSNVGSLGCWEIWGLPL